MDRVLTLPIDVLFDPKEYLQDHQDLYTGFDTDPLDEFFPSLGAGTALGSATVRKSM
jgi:hypothetical protein